jgi:hypothetical protein
MKPLSRSLDFLAEQFKGLSRYKAVDGVVVMGFVHRQRVHFAFKCVNTVPDAARKREQERAGVAFRRPVRACCDFGALISETNVDS